MSQKPTWTFPTPNLESDQSTGSQPETDLATRQDHDTLGSEREISDAELGDGDGPEDKTHYDDKTPLLPEEGISDADLEDDEDFDDDDDDNEDLEDDDEGDPVQTQSQEPRRNNHANEEAIAEVLDPDLDIDPEDYESWDEDETDDEGMDGAAQHTVAGRSTLPAGQDLPMDERVPEEWRDLMKFVMKQKAEATAAGAAPEDKTQSDTTQPILQISEQDFGGLLGDFMRVGRGQDAIRTVSGGTNQSEESTASSVQTARPIPSQGKKRTFDDSNEDGPSETIQIRKKRSKRVDRVDPIFDPDREVLDEEEEEEEVNPALSAQYRPITFDLLDRVMHDPAVFLIFVSHLDYRSFLNLYSMYRYFHYLVDSHMRTYILTNCRVNYGQAANIMPWQYYTRLITKDPYKRRSVQFPDLIRDVPCLRYLGMISYRHTVVRKIIMLLQLEDHLLPPEADTTILKIWHLLEYPYNKWRMMTLLSKRWTNEDLENATHFFIKLDMRFNDPVDSEGSLSLRKLLMHQKSLTPLWNILSGKTNLTYTKMLKLWVMTREEPDVPPTEPLWGVPVRFIGHLCREGWTRGNQRLFRPDTLIMRETINRDLDMHKQYLHMIISGYMNTDGSAMEMPIDKSMMRHILAKKQAGEPLNETETAWDEHKTAKIAHEQKLERQDRQNTLSAIFEAVATGKPLTDQQIIVLEDAGKQQREANIKEIQAKASTGEPLSNNAAVFKAELLKERKLQQVFTNPAVYGPPNDVQQATMTLRGIMQNPAMHPLSKQAKLHVAAAGVIMNVPEVQQKTFLPLATRKFMEWAYMKLRLHRKEAIPDDEMEAFLQSALEQIKEKLQVNGDIDVLADEEKILILKHVILKYFERKISAGQILSPMEEDRFEAYLIQLRNAEDHVTKKIAVRGKKVKRVEEADEDVDMANSEVHESYEGPESPEDGSSMGYESSVADTYYESTAEGLQRAIDRLADKVRTGLSLADEEKAFIRNIHERRLALARKGKQNAR